MNDTSSERFHLYRNFKMLSPINHKLYRIQDLLNRIQDLLNKSPFHTTKIKHRFLETNFTSADCLSYHPMSDCFYKLTHDILWDYTHYHRWSYTIQYVQNKLPHTDLCRQMHSDREGPMLCTLTCALSSRPALYSACRQSHMMRLHDRFCTGRRSKNNGLFHMRSVLGSMRKIPQV